MTEQLRYLQNYQELVRHLLAHHPEDEAMAMAVGGQYERFGVLEHALLLQFGLAPDSVVMDVGCGSGRLATQLARYGGLRYLGTDVVPALLDYAKRRCGRNDFHFRAVTALQIPGAAGTADFVTFFSVFTHLLHEESYVYLEEAHRVLRPGGKVVFSFLEFAVEHNWPVFRANVDWVRNRTIAGHLNVFQHRQDIRVWARNLDFAIDTFWPGDARLIHVDPDIATELVPVGSYALGQSVCVLRKRLPGEAPGPEPDLSPATLAAREKRAADRRLKAEPPPPSEQRAVAIAAPTPVAETPRQRRQRLAAAGEDRPRRRRAEAKADAPAVEGERVPRRDRDGDPDAKPPAGRGGGRRRRAAAKQP